MKETNKFYYYEFNKLNKKLTQNIKLVSNNP